MRSILSNKKGAEMAIGTIVVIILALVVLIFLVFGFSSGWSNIWEKILNFGGGEANVGTVVQACQAACATQDAYAYCGQVRTLKISKDVSKIGSCNVLSKIPNTGFSSCALDCSNFKLKTCSDLTGSWDVSCAEDKSSTPAKVARKDVTSQVEDTVTGAGPDATKNKCCAPIIAQ